MNDAEIQDIPVGRSGLLTQLGHELAKARLEKPEDILNKYLKPAISHLKDRKEEYENLLFVHLSLTFRFGRAIL